ncbi:MAG: LEA type 2 family protein [Candidatus Pacebacteria bacterium]|nr:LEA type 2 family protein [Candidatus Paceibacterota bacterium]
MTLDDEIVAPDPALSSLHFEAVTPFETTALVGVRLNNENPFPLTVDGAVYTVTLNGVAIGKGMTGEALTIPRFSSSVQQVNINISNLRLTLRAQDILSSKRMTYTLSSRLYLQGLGSEGWIRTKTEGEFLLPKQERESLQSFTSNSDGSTTTR